VIPFEGFVFEKNERKQREHHECDDLLDDLELDERERAAVFAKSDPVGRNHEAIFQESDQPTHQYEARKAGFLKKFQVLEFQVPVPGKRHEDIGKQQQQNGINPFHGLGNGLEGY